MNKKLKKYESVFAGKVSKKVRKINENALTPDNSETSEEILSAIGDLAKSQKEIYRIWQEPTPREHFKVCKIAFSEYADPDDDILFWGTSNTILRYDKSTWEI